MYKRQVSIDMTIENARYQVKYGSNEATRLTGYMAKLQLTSYAVAL